MKKLVSLMLVLAMMTVLFTACAKTTPAEDAQASESQDIKTEDTVQDNDSDAEEPETKGERVKIDFWYCWGDAIAETNEGLAKMFNESQDKYEVVPSYQGSYNDEQTKLQAAYVAGEQPTVALNESASVGIFANAGIAKDLTELAAADNFDISNINSGLLTNSYVDGKFVAVPYMRSIPIVLLNATMLEANGLDPKGPETWDDLVEYGKTLSANGIMPIEFPILNEWYFEAFINQAGGSLLTEDESKAAFNSDAGVKALAFWRELTSNGYANLVTGADCGTIYKADFLSQNTAMIITSCADLTYFINGAKEAGFEVSAAFLPKDEKYAIPTGGAQLILCNGKSDEETAGGWEFIKFLCSDEAQIYMSQMTGYVPATYSSVESETMKAFYAEYPQYKVAVDQLEYIVPRPITAAAAEAYSNIKNMLEEFLLDPSVTPETILEKYEKICNEILAD
ncbi:MAG: ABC transporter substrate-binding protein [Oscillospiraceae bacterium]